MISSAHETGRCNVVWFAHTSGRAGRRAPDIKCRSWIYLGSNYLELLAWQRYLGSDARRLALDAPLAATADTLRRPFLDLISRLGRRYTSLAWWTSRLCERNTMVSPLFLHCCHVHVARAVIERSQDSLCVVSESWAALRCLASEADTWGRDMRWVHRSLPRWRLSLRWYTRQVIGAWRFFRERCHTLRVARRMAPRDQVAPRRPCALVRTFVDDGCIRNGGEFRERFLVGVGPWLGRQGYEAWTVPVLFAVRRSYVDAWRRLRQCRQRFLNPDEFYRLFDLMFTVVVALRQAMIPRGRVRLGDLDVTGLFDEERRRFAMDRGSLDSILLSRLPYRLKQAGWHVDTVVQGYENMVLEKGAIVGFRRHMPGARIIGFQHCVVPPMLLCHFVTAEEAAIAPLPDRIICNGRLFRQNLIADGLGTTRVVEGPALRYAHLWKNKVRCDAAPFVLVALPLELGAAVELLTKVHRALHADLDISVKVKPHPMTHLPDLLRECGLDDVPEHFEFVTGGMDEWLGAARVVVSAGSAVLYEAMVGGVPTVTVGRESGLNLNPLSWLKECNPVFNAPGDIRIEVRRLWNLSAADRDAFRHRGSDLLRDSFNPVTDEWMGVFAGKNAGEAPCTPESLDRRLAVQPEAPTKHLMNVG